MFPVSAVNPVFQVSAVNPVFQVSAVSPVFPVSAVSPVFPVSAGLTADTGNTGNTVNLLKTYTFINGNVLLLMACFIPQVFNYYNYYYELYSQD